MSDHQNENLEMKASFAEPAAAAAEHGAGNFTPHSPSLEPMDEEGDSGTFKLKSTICMSPAGENPDFGLRETSDPESDNVRCRSDAETGPYTPNNNRCPRRRRRRHHDDHSSDSEDSSPSREQRHWHRNYRGNNDQHRQDGETDRGSGEDGRGNFRTVNGGPHRRFFDRRYKSGLRHRSNDRYGYQNVHHHGGGKYSEFIQHHHHHDSNMPEPYRPENSMFNQAAMFVPDFSMHSNKQRHRQLVSVSLVDNGGEDFGKMTTAEYPSNETSQASHFRPPVSGHGPDGDRPRLRVPNNHQNSNTNRNCILFIQKIPAHQNRIELLDNHFQKFGSILDIKVGGNGSELNPESALIQYSSPFEANRAYRSTEPILNNRFIKVFWANPEQASILEKEPEPKMSGSSSTLCTVAEKRTLPAAAKRDDPPAFIRKETGKRFKFGGEPIPEPPMMKPNRKLQLMLIQQYKEKLKELNNKLNELLSNQRHLLNKMELMKSDSKNVENLKKLLQSNMDRVQETRQSILDVQQSMKYAMGINNSSTKNYRQKVDDQGKARENAPAAIGVDDDDTEPPNSENVEPRNMI